MSDIEYSLPWTSEKLRLWSVQVITTWFHNPQDIYVVVIVMTSKYPRKLVTSIRCSFLDMVLKLIDDVLAFHPV